jgi:hypothetical protein
VTRSLKAHSDWQRTGEVVDLAKARRQRSRRSVGERLSAKLDRVSSACWLFEGSVHSHSGYGQLRDISPTTGKPTIRYAHIIAWELRHQMRVPAGMHVLHARECTSKTCCNPAHLRVGTRLENMDDARREGRFQSRKLNGSKAVAICAAFDAGTTIPTLAKRYDVTVQTIWKITSGKSYNLYTNRLATYVPAPTGRPRKAQLAAAA